MKIHSLTILHYGADYLPYAIRSVYPLVDECHVFYTPTPSHGHQTDTPPIETKNELMQAAFACDPDNKVRWYDMLGVNQEGIQRDLALQTVQGAGAELVLVLDYDEIWAQDTLALFLSEVWERGGTRNNLVNMIHFWRSFNWACYDEGWPVRIIDLRYSSGTHYLPTQVARVFHFGYAVRDAIMQYKWEIHGHKNEMRLGWLDNIWPTWPPPDNCHPTNGRNERGKPFWTPKPFDKSLLPEFMQEHPFYDLDKIE
jgi:hypothetical protein